MYFYKSNPAKEDTDEDGLLDGKPVKDDEGNTIVPRDDAPKTANGYADIWRLYEAEHRISAVIQTEYNYGKYDKDISRRNLISDDENYTIWICFDKGV